MDELNDVVEKIDNLPDDIKGHLPLEISRITKFLLDRGAEVKIVITGRHYRRSPLVQGGLEVPCQIKVTMTGSIINHLLMARYEELLNEPLYGTKGGGNNTGRNHRFLI